MALIELSAGPVEYDDTGGDGPVLVLLHGLLMDASLWAATVAALGPGHRCVTPTLPMGAHRRPVHPDADLSLPGLARLVVELLERLDLSDVTLVGNDTGGALVQLVLTTDAARVGKAVLVSCEAFDNLPPGATGHTLALAARLSPTLFGLFMRQLRLKAMRRLPIAFGSLTRHGDPTVRRWIEPVLRDPAVRRDTVRMLRAVFADRDILQRAASGLGAFDRPARVIWAGDDRVMPREHGRRLAALLPKADLVEVPGSRTLVPLDQP
jgi:pimeloyl-ACP methyl ester carboxylesterase